MTITSVRNLVDAELEGKTRRYTYRKVPSQTTSTAVWFDLAMSPGNPVPKYWFDAPPAIAKTISQSTDGGIFHGANVSPSSKYLRLITSSLVNTAVPLPITFFLCDYLLYYPSCDDSTTDPQVLDNTVTLPRYTDGKGVMAMAISVAGRTGGQQFNFSYTNSDGVSGRTSQTVTQNSSAAIGAIINTSTATQGNASPFIGLQDGDSGIRSIESVTMLGADVGLFTLILVKPLAQTTIKEVTAAYEKDFLVLGQALPQIQDDAYLNFICLPQGSLSGNPIVGDLKVIWD